MIYEEMYNTVENATVVGSSKAKFYIFHALLCFSSFVCY